MLLVLVLELATWIVILPFFAIWKLWDWRLSIRDDAALGIPRMKAAQTRPGALGAYRDWMDRHDPRLGEDDHR